MTENKGDIISREALKETIDEITWYHINPYGELVEGAHGDSDALFKAEDIYKAIDNALAVENITVFTESPDEKAIADLKEELQKIIAEKRPKGEREFIEILAQDVPDDLCTYPEYRGKPYYSIHYKENGEEFVGFGTYNPEVLSRYLKEYFMKGGAKND